MITITISGDALSIRQEMRDFLGMAQTFQVAQPQHMTADSVTVHTTTEPKVKGRPKGTTAAAKFKQSDVDPIPVAQDVAPKDEVPTEKEVQDAVVAVNDKFSIDKAIECLNKFSVKRARELREDQRSAFIEHCNQILAE